jgi:hypothetical protein
MSELVSNCCGAANRLITLDGPDWKDIEICPSCGDHCDWINLDKEHKKNRASIKKRGNGRGVLL